MKKEERKSSKEQPPKGTDSRSLSQFPAPQQKYKSPQIIDCDQAPPSIQTEPPTHCDNSLNPHNPGTCVPSKDVKVFKHQPEVAICMPDQKVQKKIIDLASEESIEIIQQPDEKQQRPKISLRNEDIELFLTFSECYSRPLKRLPLELQVKRLALVCKEPKREQRALACHCSPEQYFKREEEIVIEEIYHQVVPKKQQSVSLQLIKNPRHPSVPNELIEMEVNEAIGIVNDKQNVLQVSSNFDGFDALRKRNQEEQVGSLKVPVVRFNPIVIEKKFDKDQPPAAITSNEDNEINQACTQVMNVFFHEIFCGSRRNKETQPDQKKNKAEQLQFSVNDEIQMFQLNEYMGEDMYAISEEGYGASDDEQEEGDLQAPFDFDKYED